ncbi:MAG TPA: hypothetical protein VJZ71_21215 [Phycisphaerae bacterium]|nr:hypothetical protein [Phycisphaerae bacterium]
MIEKLKAQFEGLRIQLGADKKKAAILGLLALVLLVVVGRLFLTSGPNETVAAPPPLAVTAVAAQPVAPPASPSTADAAVAGRGASAALSVVEQAGAADYLVEHRVVSVTGMPRDLARDMFTTREWNKFMPAVMVGAETPSGEAGRRRRGGMWGLLRQSWSEYNREQKELSEAFHRDLQQLQLHSTMTGADPLAHISGRLVRAGDEILGFSIVRIADREVVVARGGRVASLTMK